MTDTIHGDASLRVVGDAAVNRLSRHIPRAYEIRLLTNFGAGLY